MIDLVDLTCPTPKDKLTKEVKFLATDGDNVFLIPADKAIDSGEESVECKQGFSVPAPDNFGLRNLAIEDFAVEMIGLQQWWTGDRDNSFADVLDIYSIAEKCAIRQYRYLDVFQDKPNLSWGEGLISGSFSLKEDEKTGISQRNLLDTYTLTATVKSSLHIEPVIVETRIITIKPADELVSVDVVLSGNEIEEIFQEQLSCEVCIFFSFLNGEKIQRISNVFPVGIEYES